MFARIRWFVVGLGLVVSLSLLAEDAFAQRGKGGGRGGGGRGGVSRGGGGGGRASFGRSGGGRSIGRSRGGSRSFGRSSGGRSSFGRRGGGLSIRRGGGTLRSFSRGTGRSSIGRGSRSFRAFKSAPSVKSSPNLGGGPRIGRESVRSFGRGEGLGRRQSSETMIRRRRRSDFAEGPRAFEAPRSSQRRFDGRRGTFRRGDGRAGNRGDFDRRDRDRRGDGFRFDRGDRDRFKDRRDFGRHGKFRRGRSFAGRFLRLYRRPYRSFGIYFGWPYYYDYGYGYGYGGYYDRYYFDYRSPYYLDSYLGLGCYHFSYDPTIIYPAPTDYAAVVPDASLPLDEEKQFSGDELLALGEDAFYARDYEQAVRWLRHAAIELPDDPKVLMLLSQALFATGEYGEAAGAAQAGMLVAEHADQWDLIIGNYREYYSDTQDYVDQLKSLENHVFNKDPDDLAARFLVGLQYGLLGYPKQSVRELDIVLQQAPEDRLAREFRQRMAAQLDPTPPAPEPAGPEVPSRPEQPVQSVPPETDREQRPQEAPPPTVPDEQAGSQPELPVVPGVDEAATP